MSDNNLNSSGELKKTRKIKDSRSLGRELSMQFLFQTDLSQEPPDAKKLSYFWHQLKHADCFPDNRHFKNASTLAEKIIYGVSGHLVEIDGIISKYSTNWSIHRIAVVDRNVLRIAIYEMLYDQGVPPVVSINEAVEIVKKYGMEESTSFINGVLNAFKDSIQRHAREASKSK